MSSLKRKDGGRFGIVVACAHDDRRVSDTMVAVLSLLGTYADRDGVCWPSLNSLAKRRHRSKQTISEILTKLAELGYIQIIPRQREDGGQTSNLYRINFHYSIPPEYDQQVDPPSGPEPDPPSGPEPDPPSGPEPDPPSGPEPDPLTTKENDPRERPKRTTQSFANAKESNYEDLAITPWVQKPPHGVSGKPTTSTDTVVLQATTGREIPTDNKTTPSVGSHGSAKSFIPSGAIRMLAVGFRASPNDFRLFPVQPPKSKRSRAKSVANGTSPAKSPPDKQFKPVWDAVVAICGLDASQLTDTARRSLGKVVEDLRAVGATPEEVFIRGERYRWAWPSVSLTPPALAKHWATFAASAPPTKNGHVNGNGHRKPSMLSVLQQVYNDYGADETAQPQETIR